MRYPPIKIGLIVLMMSNLLCPPFAKAEDGPKPPPDLNPRTLHYFFSDGAYVVTSPFRFDQRSGLLALGALSVTAASSLLDKQVRRHFIDSKDAPSSTHYKQGGDAVLILGPVIGAGFFAEGVAHENDQSKETGYLVYESFLWVLAIERPINYIVGRERPYSTDDPYSFNPFKINTSFTSGHTAQAFAAATIYSEQYPHWYVTVPAYSIAAFTGYSRLHASKHWMSDVVGGSMLGMYIAHTMRTHHRREDKKESAWDINFDGEQVQLARRF
jgi:membrane-associated phospholipid phosphatase